MSSRKKAKTTNPPHPPLLSASVSSLRSVAAAVAAESRSEPNLAAAASASEAPKEPSGLSSQAAPASGATAEPKAPRPAQSWYGRSSQKSIAAVSALVAEPDGSSANAETKSLASPSTPNRRATSLRLSPATAMRSQPLTGTTRLSISSGLGGQAEEMDDALRVPKKKPAAEATTRERKEPETSEAAKSTTLPASRGAEETKAPQTLKPDAPKVATETPPAAPSLGSSPQPPVGNWTSWFSKSQPQAVSKSLSDPSPDPKTPPQSPPQSQSHAEPRTIQPKVPSSPAKEAANISGAPSSDAPSQIRPLQPKPGIDVLKPSPLSSDSNQVKMHDDLPARPRSWLGLWSGSKPNDTAAEGASKSTPVLEPTPSSDRDTSMVDAPAPEKPADQKIQAKEPSQTVDEAAGSGSSWAFWSRAPSNPSKTSIGELAVAGSDSQSSPRRTLDHDQGAPTALNPAQGRKRGRPASLDGPEEGRTSSAPPLQKKAAENLSTQSAPGTPPQRPTSKRESTDMNHLLLPKFKHTYPYEPERATIFQQLGHLFYGKPAAARHPTLIRDPPRIKRALTIGVHGYFPTPLMQTVIGRPTGTSIKFAEYAARAIYNYTELQGYTPQAVEKIALEGEGRIEERLDILWKLMLNWIDKIRQADFILLACHSQGVPVAVSLAAKLIGFGCVNGARIGICAMAGVNLGPFPDYKSRWIGGSAGELFDFGRPESSVSKGYEAALDTVLRFGAKVLYVGSMDDQLVSLQSSTFGSAQHPNIYRAVWIDGRVHVSDFLTHLVGFALKVRNLGVSDHGLIRELSNPLAGSLVGGEGHSRLYEDPAVYDLAVEFTAGTTSINTEVLKVDRRPHSTSANPYILPFAMRGLLEEDFVRKQLAEETILLIQQFDEWKPNTKVLRDVKYRLEGVRSKL